jgi:DNA phosphorothioation-associated putative methyltransferase
MLATDNPGKVTLYSDGVLTSRATFQKYYTQSELRGYLNDTLGEEPIPVAPGVFFVFKDKDAEQRFQVGRYRGRIRKPPLSHLVHSGGAVRERRVRQVAPDKYEVHRNLLEPLWNQCLDLVENPIRRGLAAEPSKP